MCSPPFYSSMTFALRDDHIAKRGGVEGGEKSEERKVTCRRSGGRRVRRKVGREQRGKEDKRATDKKRKRKKRDGGKGRDAVEQVKQKVGKKLKPVSVGW